jgi:hypothetical protein
MAALRQAIPLPGQLRLTSRYAGGRAEKERSFSISLRKTAGGQWFGF